MPWALLAWPCWRSGLLERARSHSLQVVGVLVVEGEEEVVLLVLGLLVQVLVKVVPPRWSCWGMLC